MTSQPSTALSTPQKSLSFRVSSFLRTIPSTLLFFILKLLFRMQIINFRNTIFFYFDTAHFFIEKRMSFCSIIYKTIIEQIFPFLYSTFIGVRSYLRKLLITSFILWLPWRHFLRFLFTCWRFFDGNNRWYLNTRLLFYRLLWLQISFRCLAMKLLWFIAIIGIKRMLTCWSLATN